jgi:hypothetical protein
MAINPDEKPREFAILILACGLRIFGNKPWSDAEHFEAAEKFVTEA